MVCCCVILLRFGYSGVFTFGSCTGGGGDSFGTYMLNMDASFFSVTFVFSEL